MLGTLDCFQHSDQRIAGWVTVECAPIATSGFQPVHTIVCVEDKYQWLRGPLLCSVRFGPSPSELVLVCIITGRNMLVLAAWSFMILVVYNTVDKPTKTCPLPIFLLSRLYRTILENLSTPRILFCMIQLHNVQGDVTMYPDNENHCPQQSTQFLHSGI